MAILRRVFGGAVPRALRTASALLPLVTLAIAFPGVATADVLKLGMSVPMSGTGANWGMDSQWVAKQAAAEINAKGGIKAGGKTYTVEITAYDNKYNAGEGAKVAQTLLNRDGIRFIVLGIGTPPIAALQSLSEREGALLFTTSWANSIKGSKYPLTFTVNNTPTEFTKPLYQVVLQRHPNIKKIALINTNDAGGQDAMKGAIAALKSLGIEVVLNLLYERGTTEYQPIATKLAQAKPDAIDVGGAPAADAGALLKEIEAQGWRGIKIASAGSGVDAMYQAGGAAIDGTYLGMGADYSSSTATDVQRKLNEAAKKELGEPLDISTISAWDSVMAVKAGIEKANSIDARAVGKVLPQLVFESSYGPAAFGGADIYGAPQQILIPIIVTQFQNGKVVEVARTEPDELKQRLSRGQ